MSKSNACETGWLTLFFNATTFAKIADNTGTTPLTNLYVSLHVADPGEAGTQTTSECSYTSYARVAVPRTSATPGWAVSGNSVSPTQSITFPACTGGSQTATHFGIGELSTTGGALYYVGTVTPNQAISSGVTPVLSKATAIVED